MYKPRLPFWAGSRPSCCDSVVWLGNVCVLETAAQLQSLALLLFSHRKLVYYVTSQNLTLLIINGVGVGVGTVTPVL